MEIVQEDGSEDELEDTKKEGSVVSKSSLSKAWSKRPSYSFEIGWISSKEIW